MAPRSKAVGKSFETNENYKETPNKTRVRLKAEREQLRNGPELSIPGEYEVPTRPLPQPKNGPRYGYDEHGNVRRSPEQE